VQGIAVSRLHLSIAASGNIRFYRRIAKLKRRKIDIHPSPSLTNRPDQSLQGSELSDSDAVSSYLGCSYITRSSGVITRGFT
jgi:hypothetical protein